MKVVMDMVANHAGPEHAWAADPPTPTWFAGTTAQHLPNNWKMASLADPYGAKAVQDSTLFGWFAGILPDFDQRDPEVARYLIQNTLWWAATTGIDAIRQDTWVYVPRSFWRSWMAAIKREHPRMTVVGEVLNEDPTVVAFFEGSKTNFDGIRTGIDQVFDFPLQAAARRVFQRGGSVRELAQTLAYDRLYDHPERLVTVTDNHDLDRLPFGPGATDDGLLLAYTFLLTSRGIPQLYYGNEIGLQGGGDPDNRRDFPGGWREDPRDAFSATGRDAREARIFTHVESLLRLRRERPELRETRTEHLLVEAQQFVYRRGGTVVAINNSAEPVTVRVPGLTLGRAAVIGGCGVPRQERDGVVIELGARVGCVF
jgi:glycosidase